MTDIPQMSRNRCGCDCKNPTSFAVCDGRELNVCCTHCASGAPSAYAVHWECERSEAYIATVPPLMFLWRDCPFECKWAAKDSKGYSSGSCSNNPCASPYSSLGACVADATGYSGGGRNYGGKPCDTATCSPYITYAPYSATDTCGNDSANWWPPIYTDPDTTYLNWGSLPFKCCQDAPQCCFADRGNCALDGWHDWYGLSASPGVLSSSLGICTGDYAWQLSNCLSTVWELAITGSSSATLTGFAATGHGQSDIVYTCDDFSCLDRSTFILSNRDDLLSGNAFPEKVCVSPAVGNYRTPCSSAQAACNCKDAGWSSGYLTIDSLCIPGVSGIGLPRNATLPSCVTPQGGSCGYFWGTTTAYSGTLGFLVWCGGGTPYDMDVYCTTNNWSTCSKVCDASMTETAYCPDGEAFTWSCSSFGACCAIPCSDCDPAGKTLNYDITGVGTGSGTFAGGGIMCFSETLSTGDRMSVEINMSTCTGRVGCNGTDCGTFCLASVTPTLNTCEPFDMTVAINIGFLCSACDSGSYTVHIYE